LRNHDSDLCNNYNNKIEILPTDLKRITRYNLEIVRVGHFWKWGIQVLDFKKLWGFRNHCILCFQGKTIHDNSVTKFTFEFSISHRKHFLNLKYKYSATYFLMSNNNKSLISHCLFVFVFLLIIFFIIESQWSNACIKKTKTF
jgi:hypothetical protein